MSFFEDNSNNSSQHFYHTPPTPIHIQYSPHGQHTTQSNPLAWESDRSRGLGLLPSGKSFAPVKSPLEPQQSSAYIWSPFVPQSHSFPQHPQSWQDTPSATEHSTMWNTFPVASIEGSDVYDCSDYSSSTVTSVYSSPYSAAAPLNRSPHVKLESPFDTGYQMVNYNQRSVNPQDITTFAPIMTPSMAFSPTHSPLTPAMTDLSVYTPQHLQLEVETSPVRRQRRKLTATEDALCTCKVCGKMFSRWHNLQSHMDTHEPDRVRSWICEVSDCGMKFARRTDMERHNISVHSRTKNHNCIRCNRGFARRDTLLRHQTTGCQKTYRQGRKRQQRLKANATTTTCTPSIHESTTRRSTACMQP